METQPEQMVVKQPKRWIEKVPDTVWSPLASAGLLLIVGLISLAFDQPWLFPSLGPTAFLQTQTPDQPAARIYNTFVGHIVGLGAGFLGVALFAANADPSVMTSGHLTFARLAASVVAIGLTLLIGLLLKAPHPPAAATTLLITLGGLQFNLNTAVVVIIGVGILAGLGEIVRRLRVGQLSV